MLGSRAEVVQWRGRQDGLNFRDLAESVSNILNDGKVASLRGVHVKPESVAVQKYVLESLLGMGVVSPDLVLVELRDSDSSKNTDNRYYDQQFYECEACRVLVGWMLLHGHPQSWVYAYTMPAGGDGQGGVSG